MVKNLPAMQEMPVLGLGRSPGDVNGQELFTFLKSIENPKEYLFMWVIFINTYHIIE